MNAKGNRGCLLVPWLPQLAWPALGACLACALHACHCGGSGCVHVRTAAAAVAGVPGLRAGTRSLESGNLSTMALAEPIPD